MTRRIRSLLHRRPRGQGVIEYAGSLVIATFLVSLAMFVVPEEIASLLDTIMTSAIEFFMESLPNSGGA